jgi:hypothetical protein
MVRASLESVAAMVVELQVRDLEEVERAGESVADDLQVLREDLEILESTLAEAWSPADES